MTRFRTVARRLCALALPIPARSPAVAAARIERGPSDSPRRHLQQRHQGHQRRPEADASVRPRATRGAASTPSLTGPFQGDPNNEHVDPAARLDGFGQRRGRRPDHRLLRRAGGHRRQRLRRVQGPDLRGRHRHVQPAQGPDRGPGQAERGRRTGAFQEQCKQALEQAGGDDTSACDIDLETLAHEPHQRGHRGRRRHGDDPHPRRRDVTQILTDIGNLAAASRAPPARASTRRSSARSRTRSPTRRSTSTRARTTTCCASSTST